MDEEQKRRLFLITTISDAIPFDKHYTTLEVFHAIEVMHLSLLTALKVSLKGYDAIAETAREEYIRYLKERDTEG